jgi:hypothetical protein
VSFDFGTFKRHSAKLAWDDLDLESFARQPLPDAALRCLRFMHDIEYHTICYLRDLLVTPAHADPEVTAFLSCWAYEEHWHGEALAAVLAAHGEVAGVERTAGHRVGLGWRDRVRPLLMTLGAGAAGRDVLAVQMTWGAVNEWSTQAGYAQLVRRSGHPTLGALLGRIMRQEGRHIDFYATQARARLATSARARWLTRQALRHLWHPVGAGVMPPAETDFMIGHLFGDAEGHELARRIDRRVDRLPGLSGLALLERARAETLSRTGAAMAARACAGQPRARRRAASPVSSSMIARAGRTAVMARAPGP